MENPSNTIWTDKKRTVLGLPISFTRYILTDKKFILRHGFLNITEHEVELYKIIDKTLLLPFGQRLFGCGSVKIIGKDVDLPELTVGAIKNPRKFYEVLDEHVEIQRNRYRIKGRDMVGASYGIDNDLDITDIDEHE